MKLTSKVTPLTGIDFNEQNRVEFIEFLAGIDGDIQPQIYGVNAFEVGADELYDILEEKMMEKSMIARTDIPMLF